jgi:hypothetical protein
MMEQVAYAMGALRNLSRKHPNLMGLACLAAIGILVVFLAVRLPLVLMRQSMVDADRVLLRMGLRATVITNPELIEDLAASIRPHRTWWSPIQEGWTIDLSIRCISESGSFDVVGGGGLELASAPGGSRVAMSTFDKAEELLDQQSVRLPVRYTDLEELDRLIRSSNNAEGRNGLDGAELWMPTLAEETDPPDAAVYWTNVKGSLKSPLFKEPLIVVAVWERGKVIWSQQESTGGPPYIEAPVDSDVLLEVLSELQRTSDDGLVPNPDQVKQGWYPCSIMVSSSESGGIHLMSHHELEWWSDSAQPEEQESFESQWAEIRRLMKSLIPQEGTPKPGISFDWPAVFF